MVTETASEERDPGSSPANVAYTYVHRNSGC
jgi:hypothetical protein